MKIYHAADIHLGRRRLDGRLPDTDLAEAFEYIVRAAIDDQADVFLIAGDLFDRAQVEPSHLRQAQRILSLLKAAKIPVVAIEGNHDKAFVSSNVQTWLDYLAQEDLLHILKPSFDASGALLSPWNPETKCGSFIDLNGVRFVGAGYLGAATPHKIRQILEKLTPDHPHVLLLHAGPDYFVGEGGGFSTGDLRAIHERVSYLALGHIHKPMLHGGWACNPGSPENCDLREALYEVGSGNSKINRGYAVVELDSQDQSKTVSVSIRSNPRRPCLHLDLDCTPFFNKRKDVAAALENAALTLIQTHNPAPASIVELRLTGHINLDRIAFDSESLNSNIQRAAGVFAVSINSTSINLPIATVCGANEGEIISREELERAALLQLVNEDFLWGLDGEQQAAASFFFELKEAVRHGRTPAELAEMIRANSLVEKVRAAKSAAPVTPIETVTATP